MFKSLDYYKKITAKILNRSLPNNSILAKDILEFIFDDLESIERIKVICDTYEEKDYSDSVFLIKTIPVKIVQTLRKNCDKEKIGFIILYFKDKDDKEEKTKIKLNEDDTVNILFLSK